MLLLDLIGAPQPKFTNVVLDPETGSNVPVHLQTGDPSLPGSCDSLFSELAAVEESLAILCPQCMSGPR